MRVIACALALATAVACAMPLERASAQPVEVIVGGPTPKPAPVAHHQTQAAAVRPTRVAHASAVPAGQSELGARTSDAIVRYALAYVGRPYVWGGQSPAGFDCSGFTWFTFHMLGIAIPRTADAQFAVGFPVAQPLPGDLVFFQTYDYGASHVGIYLGRGLFVSSIADDVHVSSFASEYFRSRFIGARRVARVE